MKAAPVIVSLYVDLNNLVDNADALLAVGSLVQIVQSTDGVADGFQTYGNSWILNSTVGDDTLIAEIPVGYGDSGAGKFFWSAELDIDVNSTYFYIRFFDYLITDVPNLYGNPSNLYWGQSAVYLAGSNFNLSVDIEFAPTADLGTDSLDSFIVIPEPSSMSFFALVGGMAVAMRSQLIRRKRRQQLEAAQAESSSS